MPHLGECLVLAMLASTSLLPYAWRSVALQLTLKLIELLLKIRQHCLFPLQIAADGDFSSPAVRFIMGPHFNASLHLADLCLDGAALAVVSSQGSELLFQCSEPVCSIQTSFFRIVDLCDGLVVPLSRILDRVAL